MYVLVYYLDISSREQVAPARGRSVLSETVFLNMAIGERRLVLTERRLKCPHFFADECGQLDAKGKCPQFYH